jgi:hypothetical protein
MTDDLRPRGSVQVACSCGCRWEFWIDALDPRLPEGPFYSDGCSEACAPGCDGMSTATPQPKTGNEVSRAS